MTVTRTTGTMAAVTVDIDLTTQPSLPTNHQGYEFVKAASGLPATILPDTRGPQNFTAAPGDGQAVLSWTAPASGSGVTRHEYRQKEGTGSYGNWMEIPNSAEDGANEDGYTVAGMESGGGTDTLVFVYVVTADDRDADGVSIGDDALRLDGDDRIGNGAGDRAELAHDGPGAQPGHRVDGERRAGVHTHAAFTHGHSVFNNGKRFYTQEYPSHTHEGHEHPDTRVSPGRISSTPAVSR